MLMIELFVWDMLLMPVGLALVAKCSDRVKMRYNGLMV